MERLRHSDYRRLLDFVAGLQEPVALADFGRHMVRLTSGLLPGATIAFDQIDESGGQYGFDHNIELDPAEQAKVHGRLREVYRENPIYGYIQNGGKGPLVDLADLMPRREFQRTEFYQDIFRPYDIEHQLSVLVPREGWINTLTINRDRAIPERMKTLLALACRHIQLAQRNACLTDRLLTLPAADGGGRLTARECEVFAWLREGKRNAEIGVILGCSPRTIDKHVQNILRKTGAETRTAAVRERP
jgi:DNA-binding CsgD family transcriptional regulator